MFKIVRTLSSRWGRTPLASPRSYSRFKPRCWKLHIMLHCIVARITSQPKQYSRPSRHAAIDFFERSVSSTICAIQHRAPRRSDLDPHDILKPDKEVGLGDAAGSHCAVHIQENSPSALAAGPCKPSAKPAVVENRFFEDAPPAYGRKYPGDRGPAGFQPGLGRSGLMKIQKSRTKPDKVCQIRAARSIRPAAASCPSCSRTACRTANPHRTSPPALRRPPCPSPAHRSAKRTHSRAVGTP